MSLPHSIEEKTLYRDHWSHNAANYQSQGCYEWMTAQLDPLSPKKILDVGCGVGNGVLALLERFAPTIVSLEENADCMRTTCEAVNAAGVPVAGLFRLSYKSHPDGTHDQYTDPRELSISRPVTVIHTDVLFEDLPLESLLKREGPFDAVTLWLMGAVNRQTCRALKGLMIDVTGPYRLHVQNAIYLLADRLLRPGGWLHIVDRGMPLRDEAWKNEIIRGHREQASRTSLEFREIASRSYDEGGGVELKPTPGTSGRVSVSTSDLEMISVIFQLPENPSAQ